MNSLLEMLDDRQKLLVICFIATLIIGILLGIFINISNLPFLPRPLKMGAQVYKGKAEPIINAQENAIRIYETTEPFMNNPNERLICISKDGQFIVSLNQSEASNFQAQSFNIFKNGKEINLENCRLLSELEKENFDISEGWMQKLSMKL